MKCENCGKRPVMMMVEQFNPVTNEKRHMKLCLHCAKDLGLFTKEQMKQNFKNFFGSGAGGLGINDEDIDDILENFENMISQQVDSYSEDDYDEDMLGNSDHMPLDGREDSDYKHGEHDFIPLDISEIDDPYGIQFDSTTGKVSGGGPSPINPFREPGAKTKTRSRRGKKLIGKALRRYSENLTEKAALGEVDRIIGRHNEIDRVVQILNRRRKNNPMLIGDPGVGKTAIAEGLAVRIHQKEVPHKLQDKQVLLLDLTEVVAGTQFRGQFEQRMKEIITEAKAHGNVILVIDEVHNIMGAGEVHGGLMNAANILKPALASGDVQVIGVTTTEEYRKHIEKDAALARRFQPVMVEEPSESEAAEILEGIKDYYEQFHLVKISKDVIDAAVQMSKRYIPERFLPDKAIDVLDEAGSRKNLLNQGLIEHKKMTEEFDRLLEEHADASEAGEYDRAAELRTQFLRLKEKIEKLESQNSAVQLEVGDIAHVVEKWTGIPVQKITEEEAGRLINLESRLHSKVISQDSAVSAISRAVRRSRSGFRNNNKPASFIFVGPTGVGKTELAKALAIELFGTEEALIRLDMSEYMEKHTVSKLIGAPPGYIGFDEGGQLTERIRRRPYSVILLDEIEKAHPDVYNMLLQILDDGRLTDSNGRTTFFENTIIIMTSNVGTSKSEHAIGFSGSNDKERSESYIIGKLREEFRPEFLNRIDEIAVFTPLSKEHLADIFELLLKEININVEAKNMQLDVSPALKNHLIEKGYNPKYGARPLRRVMQTSIEDEIAEMYIMKTIEEGDYLLADLEDGEVKITKKDQAAGTSLAQSPNAQPPNAQPPNAQTSNAQNSKAYKAESGDDE